MNSPSIPARLARSRTAPRTGWIVPAIALSLLATLPLFLSSYFQDLALRIIILAIFALSLELLVGTTGLVSFGHAAFFGIAAYVTALAAPETEAGALLIIAPLAMLAAGGYALLVGALSLRTKGVYFIMVTLAFAQMAYYVFHDTAIGGGSDGMYLMQRPVLAIGGVNLIDLDNARHLYFFALAALAGTYGFLALLQRSRFGHALAGIRTNEQRMRAAGYQTYYYKLAAFVLAGMLAGMAGFLMGTKNGVINPEMLSWHESGAVLLMIILGGLGSLRGAVIGAVAFVLLKEFYSSEAIFGEFAARWQLPLGMTMIFCVALLPDGLIGLGRRINSLRGAKPHATAEHSGAQAGVKK
jgi:branched-chain amino acid transport system permease protein